MNPPTQRQQAVWQFLVDFQAAHGRLPTLRQVAARFGFNSHNSALEHYRLMEKKGLIKAIGRGKHKHLVFLPTTPPMPVMEIVDGKLQQTGTARTTIVGGRMTGQMIWEDGCG